MKHFSRLLAAIAFASASLMFARVAFSQTATDDNARVTLIPYFQGQYNNVKYSVRIEDPAGVGSFQILNSSNAALFVGSGACQTAVESALLDVPATAYPLKYYVQDCFGNEVRSALICPTRQCGGGFDLLSNGSFEQNTSAWFGSGTCVAPGSTALVPWSVTNAFVTVYGANYFPAADGSNSLALNCGGGPGTVTQDFAATPGKGYRLSFYFAPLPWDGQTNSIQVFWNGVLLDSLSSIQPPPYNFPYQTNWSRYEYNVTAPGSLSTVTFNNNGNWWPLIDAIRLIDPTGGTAVSAGFGVTASPTVTLPDGTTSAVSMTFEHVEATGSTAITTSSYGPPPPSGFRLTSPPIYYEISTTATFSGAVRVCLGWTEGQIANEATVALFHYEAGHWVNITDASSRDTANNTVCGITMSFSPFTLFDASYLFSGFYQPVDNLPVLNKVKAGSAIPVKFSLGGYHGINIFSAGFPRVQPIQCDSGAAVDAVEETISAGQSTLSYDAATDRYIYVWKTDKSWASSCRQLQVGFNDGEIKSANFTLTR